MKFKSYQKGFTLIELLVVIAIISLLSSVVLAALRDAREKAATSKYAQNALQIRNALELYRSDFNIYPGEGARVSVVGSAAKSFLESYLVANNYISEIPSISAIDSEGDTPYFYDTGTYTSTDYDGDFGDFDLGELYISCGGKIPTSYVLGFYTKEENLNFPKLGWIEQGVLGEHPDQTTNIWYDTSHTLEGWYCVSQ